MTFNNRIIICLLLWWCSFPVSGLIAQDFSEVTFEVGVTNPNPANGEYGNGICVHDWNKDGWDDFIIATKNLPPQFYENNGDGTFSIKDFGITNLVDMKQILMADVDNDGDADIFINNYKADVKLYINNGDYTFTDFTDFSGLEMNAAEGFGAGFGDYDLDGDLDLYISNYDYDAPLIENLLYRNNGNGNFTNVTAIMGVGNNFQASFQSVFIDHDRDGWQDIMVANDRMVFENTLYENNEGEFTDVGGDVNANQVLCSMCATVGDYDNDADLDIYITNTFSGNLLLNNFGDFFFDVADEENCLVNKFCWGSIWIDIDNDMWKDLFVCTTPAPLQGTSGENFLYKNNSGLGFVYQNQTVFSMSEGETRVVAVGDFNNDGFADIITHSNAPYNTQIYYNNSTDGNYLKFDLDGVVSNLDGIGSFIEIWADGDYAMEYTLCGESYLAQHSQYEILGLGEHEMADSVKITWLSGIVDCYYDVEANQTLVITEGETLFATIESGVQQICSGDSTILSVGDYESYLWSTGESDPQIFGGLGHYWVTVTTFEGLVIQSDTMYVSEFPMPGFGINTIDILCQGDSTGSATLVYVDGPEIVDINWSDGQEGEAAENLVAGIYSVSILDANSCISEYYVELIQPDSISADLDISNISCFGANDGSINVTIFGGVAPYELNWNGIDPDTCIQGDHLLTITDVNGCIEEFPFTILEPAIITLDLVVGGITTEENGSAIVEIEGGTPPYTIGWSNGEMDLLTINDLPEGDFWVMVTDSMGCEITENFTITDIPNVRPNHENFVLLYPNPFSTQIDLQFTSNYTGNIRVFNISGQLIYKSFENDIGQLQLDTSQWTPGTYHIVFNSEYREIRYKMLKSAK